MVANAAASSVAFSPDGRTLAMGSEDHGIILWDTTDPGRPHRLSQVLTGHSGPVSSVAFSPTEHILASAARLAQGNAPTASGGRTVIPTKPDMILWDTTNPAQPRKLGGRYRCHDLAVGHPATQFPHESQAAGVRRVDVVDDDDIRLQP